MNAHNPAWFASAEETEYSSYAQWSRQHPLLTAQEEHHWLSQHQDASLAILRLTQAIGKDWWQRRYPNLEWENRDWVAVVWEKRPSFGDLNAVRRWYLSTFRGETMIDRLWDRLTEARELLLGSNIRLVFSVAHQHTGQGLDLTDLVQEGQLGLMRALEKFDTRQGTRFSTYSHYWIQQFIRLALKNQSSLIRKPTNVVDDLKRFHRQLVGIQQRHGRSLSVSFISRELEMPEHKVRHFMEIGQIPLSINAPLSEEGSESWVDTLADPGLTTAEVGERLSMSENIRESLNHLNRREQVIVAMRYGIGHGREYGYREISEQLGVSRERVRQIEKEALGKLRGLWSESTESEESNI